MKKALTIFAALFAAFYSLSAWAPYSTGSVVVADPTACGASCDNWAIVRSTNQESLYIYRTFTNVSNYESLALSSCSYTPPGGSLTSNICIFSNAAGTGSTRRIELGRSWAFDIAAGGGGTGFGNFVPLLDNTYNIGALGANPQRPSQVHAAIKMTIAGSQVPYTVCKTAVAAAAPADTSEDTLFTCTIPIGAMGNQGAFRMRVMLTTTNNANNKTVRVRFNGASGTAYLTATFASAASLTGDIQIQNRNFSNSQVGTGFALASSAVVFESVATSAVDTSNASVDVVVTCQKVVAGDSCQFEAATGEILQ